jgi:nitroreductase
MATVHPGHEPILADALRAPSAHNAQAWRLAPLDDGRSYELHYNHHEYLPHDPEDRDAYLGLGAFFETLHLAADRRGRRVGFRGVFERAGADLLVGVIEIGEPDGGSIDPLAGAAVERRTNRAPYRRGRPVPPALAVALAEQGCVCIAPRRVLPLAIEASMRSWADRQFVTDLRRWIRFSGPAPDGMTPEGLGLSRLDTTALRAAFRLGRLPWPAGLLYASRELHLTMASSTLAVLSADAVTPEALFDAGRRLLRAWVSVAAAGWACHPISIVIDRPETAPRLGRLVGTAHPVALFRIGWTGERAPVSNRRDLRSVLCESRG